MFKSVKANFINKIVSVSKFTKSLRHSYSSMKLRREIFILKN